MGKYDKVSIVKSLRKLDKVIKDSKGRGSYLEEVSQVPEESYPIEYDLGDDDDDPDFVFVAEGDLDQIIEESDVHEALAAYQDVRRALKEQRSGRGFFGGGKGKGPASLASQVERQDAESASGADQAPDEVPSLQSHRTPGSGVQK